VSGSVVAVAFQSDFHSKLHQNNVFFIFKKIIFDITHQNDPKTLKKILILSKKKIIFFGNAGWTAFPNGPIKSHAKLKNKK